MLIRAKLMAAPIGRRRILLVLEKAKIYRRTKRTSLANFWTPMHLQAKPQHNQRLRHWPTPRYARIAQFWHLAKASLQKTVEVKALMTSILVEGLRLSVHSGPR